MLLSLQYFEKLSELQAVAAKSSAHLANLAVRLTPILLLLATEWWNEIII
jgi:hypothetical protein